MATASDGVNPGRTGVPARQVEGGGPARNGRQTGGLDPTNQLGQTDPTIFGMPTGIASSGMKGSSDFKMPDDVTLEAGQLDDDFGHSTEQFVKDSGMPGSEGCSPQHGGESVTYTDPWALIGGVTREQTVQGATNGPGDWTTWGADNGFSGPTLPGLENNRPTDSGAGHGHVRGHAHPNAGQ
jgi:hypothetical protein